MQQDHSHRCLRGMITALGPLIAPTCASLWNVVIRWLITQKPHTVSMSWKNANINANIHLYQMIQNAIILLNIRSKFCSLLNNLMIPLIIYKYSVWDVWCSMNILSVGRRTFNFPYWSEIILSNSQNCKMLYCIP